MNEEILMSRHEATDNAILTYETVTKVPYKVSEKDTATLVHKEIIMGARLEDEISQFSTIASFSGHLFKGNCSVISPYLSINLA